MSRPLVVSLVYRISLQQWNILVNHAGKFLQRTIQCGPAEPSARRVARTRDEVGNKLYDLPVRQPLLRLFSAALVILASSACASSEYMGISFRSGMVAPELQELARRARAGDKHAQLGLGILYEEGRGVARDVAKARSLYMLAATDSGGPVWVYVPSVSEGKQGRVMQIGKGSRRPGLTQAKVRLEALGD